VPPVPGGKRQAATHEDSRQLRYSARGAFPFTVCCLDNFPGDNFAGAYSQESPADALLVYQGKEQGHKKAVSPGQEKRRPSQRKRQLLSQRGCCKGQNDNQHDEDPH
jgi:hypothetical protein